MERAASPAREKAYEFLKTSVLSGGFTPGERMTEEHLAARLGISRTPIREALHRLASEGLLKPFGTRGFVVPQDTRAEMEELFEIRAVLEGYALRVISGRITEPVLERLEEAVREGELALREGRLDAVFHWNTWFHDTLHELIADKHRLCEQMVTMRKYVLRYRKDTLQSAEGARRTLDGHRKIMLSLRLRDGDLCERVMREHIRVSMEDALPFASLGHEEV